VNSKVKVGFFSFTEITDPSEHRAYNEWHQLDHMPEQFPLVGVAFGQRWVSTPACAHTRVVSDASLDATHYMTLYLMTEPVERTLREFYDLGGQLRALGRFHRHRRSHLSGPLRVLEGLAAPRVLISADAVPYRPNQGVYVVVEEAHDRARLDERTRWLHVEHHPALLDVPGVAGLWTFSTSAAFRDHPWETGNRRITVLWLDDDPLSIAPKLDAADAPRRARDDATRVTFSGPFETIHPWHWDWFDDPKND
jgi:hypothetical protein